MNSLYSPYNAKDTNSDYAPILYETESETNSTLTRIQNIQEKVNEHFKQMKKKTKDPIAADNMELQEHLDKIILALSQIPRSDVENLLWWKNFYSKVESCFDLLHWGATAVIGIDSGVQIYQKITSRNDEDESWISPLSIGAMTALTIANSLSKLFKLKEKAKSIEITLDKIKKTQIMDAQFSNILKNIQALKGEVASRDLILSQAFEALADYAKHERLFLALISNSLASTAHPANGADDMAKFIRYKKSRSQPKMFITEIDAKKNKNQEKGSGS